jgi:cell wall-associated NlpC family hydrolase
MATSAGTDVPHMSDDSEWPPTAEVWASQDPNAIPGWVIVTDPQPGDVVAQARNYIGTPTGHVGIVVGNGMTISVRGGGSVTMDQFGFVDDPNHTGPIVFRRYVGVED